MIFHHSHFFIDYIVCSGIERVSNEQCHVAYKDIHQIHFDDFTPPTDLVASFQDDENPINPSVAIQLTRLACEGTVLAIKIAHSLADAHTLVYFGNDWARVSNAMATGSSLSSLSPNFEPSRLNLQAAGEIDKPEGDDALIKKGMSLPFHRYDWWAPAEGCPVEAPEPFKSRPFKPTGKPMPWREWNVAAPVSRYMIYLSVDQIQRVWEVASTSGVNRISRHNAFVAHICLCINQARYIRSTMGWTNDNRCWVPATGY